MRIDGVWVRDEDGLQRPVIHATVRTQSGDWVDCPFLLDTGADRTVLSAGVLVQLGLATTQAVRQLGGIGGVVETVHVWTEIRFTDTTGSPATIGATYAAFTDATALEESVLGRDVLGLFAVIVDKGADTVCLLHGRHRYVIQES